MNGNLIVTLAYGLPSSGKTTLIRQLIGLAEAEPRLKDFECLHLEVDGLETLISAKIEPETNPVLLRSQLKDVLGIGYEYSKASNDQAKEFCFELVRQMVIACSTGQGSGRWIIFVDDNHLKKGVRRRFMKLCRNACVPYVELFVGVPVEVAVQRATLRVQKPIAEEVIRADHQSAELAPSELTLSVEEPMPCDPMLMNKWLELCEKSKQIFEAFKTEQAVKPKSSEKGVLSEIEELLRSLVREVVLAEIAKSKGFSQQALLADLKKEYFEHLKKIFATCPNHIELSTQCISDSFLRLVKSKLDTKALCV